MPINRFFLSDFVAIQRNSFLHFLEKGLIEEFSKRNPITNSTNTLEVFFYPEYYQLTKPKYNTHQAIINGKSYASRLYIPVQLTDKKSKIIKFKWVYLADLPIMTKRGHFIINGAARVIVNQIIRSPGIYYQTKIYENFTSQWEQKAESFYERHYADLICQRGTWLRLEIDKDKKIWAQTKRGPKIPIMWLLIAMGLNEKMIFKSVIDPQRLIYNMLEDPDSTKSISAKSKIPDYIKTPPEAWAKIYMLFSKQKITTGTKQTQISQFAEQIDNADQQDSNTIDLRVASKSTSKLKVLNNSQNQTNSNSKKGKTKTNISIGSDTSKANSLKLQQLQSAANAPRNFSNLGRQLIFNKFMNPRTYDLSKQGRLSFNKKLNLTVSPYHTTLSPQDLVAATDYLLKVEYGLKKVDDIDHLKNRRVRTSGELIQIQLGTGLVRLEKYIKDKMESTFTAEQNKYRKFSSSNSKLKKAKPKGKQNLLVAEQIDSAYDLRSKSEQNNNNNQTNIPLVPKQLVKHKIGVSINTLINTKPVNSALREFFGTSPLSQFMDQINPLAELTHKRRLSSMGPGGVTRDSATLEIRGIHPSHYGRICPVETPEGKNTGLVNSLTTYARVNPQGFIETPFYKVYKGQVQQKLGMYYFSAEQEDKIKLGASDLAISDIGFLSTSNIPVRIEDEFSKISRNVVEYVGISPLQMVSIATSLIPFLEHDDANRALMGSNMQRQAVPILKPERPIVGTGLEARAVSDSGHALQAKTSGLITYVSSEKLIIYNF